MLATIPPDSPTVAVRAIVTSSPPVDDIIQAQTSPGLVEAAQAYLDRLASGDVPPPDLQAAWEEFYKIFNPILIRLTRCRRVLADDVDDQVQEVWQTVVIHLKAFRPDPAGSPFEAWLRVVARHQLARSQQDATRRSVSVSSHEVPDRFVGREPDPAEFCERLDDRARVSILLGRLRAEVSPLNYRVLEMRAIEERGVSETAQVVGLLPNQVRVRHHRMLTRLRQLAGSTAGQGSGTPEIIPKNFLKFAQQKSAACLL